MSEAQEPQSVEQLATESAMALAKRVLGRAPTSTEADALISIFRAAAQALSDGFIVRLAEHVQAERREESIEEFFENKVKAD